MVLKPPRYLSTRALARFDACTSDGFESRKIWRSLYAARFEPSWFSIRVPCASAFLLFSVSSGDSNAVICGRDCGWVVISRIITHHAYNEQRNINIHIFCFYDRASLFTEYHLNLWTLIQARMSATNVEQSKRPTSPLLNLKACPWCRVLWRHRFVYTLREEFSEIASFSVAEYHAISRNCSLEGSLAAEYAALAI